MITKERKKEIISDLVDKLKKQKAIVFFDYTGLKVNQFQDLRGRFKEQGIDCQVVKKTLIDLILGKAGLEIPDKIKKTPGQVALVLGYQDEIIPAKILYEFAKENEEVKILAGIVQGDYLKNEAIINLAKLPSKQELFAKLIGSISAPAYGLVNTLRGNLRKLVFVLSNIKKEA